MDVITTGVDVDNNQCKLIGKAATDPTTVLTVRLNGKVVGTAVITIHTHTYSSTWSSDDTYHWHASTCGHLNAVDGKEEHRFVGGKCEVCERPDPNYEEDTPTISFESETATVKVGESKDLLLTVKNTEGYSFAVQYGVDGEAGDVNGILAADHSKITIEGRAKGKVTITVTAEKTGAAKITATCTVTVTADEPTYNLTPSAKTIKIGTDNAEIFTLEGCGGSEQPNWEIDGNYAVIGSTDGLENNQCRVVGTAVTDGAIALTVRLNGSIVGTAAITVVEEDTPPHTHTPAEAWTSDAAGHWHACAGESCTESLALRRIHLTRAPLQRLRRKPHPA